MNALLEKELDVVELNRPRRRTEAQRRPNQIRVRTTRKSRAKGMADLAATTVMAGLICFLAYSASALGGHVMLEQARREGLRATERVKRSNRDLARLSDRVNRLKSLREIDDWAVARNMSRTEPAAPAISEGTRVALR